MPKDRRLPVAATPQSAAVSCLALYSVPQHRALPRRITPENVILPEHDPLLPDRSVAQSKPV
jgi:hypothetical protein